MRVTTTSLYNSVIRNISDAGRDINDLNDQISSGKRIRHASDDPTGATVALGIRTRLGQLDGQERGRQAADDWLNASDSQLSSLSDTLLRVKELSVQGANGVLDPDARRKIADEMDQLVQHAVVIANGKVGDRFLFAGVKTDTPPFAITTSGSATTVTYAGSTDPVRMQVAQGVVMDVGVTGDRLQSAISAMAQMADTLRAGSAVTPAQLTAIDAASDTVLDARSVVGAKLNRTKSMGDLAAGQKVTLQTQLSEVEDTDIVETVLALTSKQNVYQAALAVGGRVLQPSLLQFLR